MSPKTLFLYGPPKMGKTGRIADLPDALILDFEKGAHPHECMSLDINNLSEYNEALAKVREDTLKLREDPKHKNDYRYTFGVIDTIDELEAAAEYYHTILYNNDVKKNPTNADGTRREMVKTVYDLAYGKGYYYIREEMKSRIKAAEKVFKYVILVGHLKDKSLTVKTGNDIADTEINLTGKLASIITSMCDAIGYVYRDEFTKDSNGDAKLMVSFQSIANITRMGARHAHLRGKILPLEWNLIYPDVNLEELRNKP